MLTNFSRVYKKEYAIFKYTSNIEARDMRFVDVLRQMFGYIQSTSKEAYIISIVMIFLPILFALYIYKLEDAKFRHVRPVGCRKLSLTTPSNLSNEFDEQFPKNGASSITQTLSEKCYNLQSIWIYPIKSCKGVELGDGDVISTGLEYDRQFTFAEEVNLPTSTSDGNPQTKWQFITQRQYSSLANVRVEMWVPHRNTQNWSMDTAEVQSRGVIDVSFPHPLPGWKGLLSKLVASMKGVILEKHFRVPFDPSPAQVDRAGYCYEKITIWKDTVVALNISIELPRELQDYLGMSKRLGLFRIDNRDLRKVYRNAPSVNELGWQPVTAFQDAYPLHLLNLASVQDVKALMPRAKGPPRLSATRFRANLIITGPDAYLEESWRRIRIGCHEYDVSARTARCKLPNIDQETGEKHRSEPDATLRSFRAVDRGSGPGIGCLGMQLVPVDTRGVLKVGDNIEVLEVGEHIYIKQ